MTGKTSSLNLTNSFQTIIENEPESGNIIEIITLIVSNIASETSIVDIVITRNSEDFFVLKSGNVPANNSLSVFLSKDFGIYLEPGDSLRLKADDGFKADATCSYYIINNSESSNNSSSSEGSSSSSEGSSSSSEGSSSSSEGSSSSSEGSVLDLDSQH